MGEMIWEAVASDRGGEGGGVGPEPLAPLRPVAAMGGAEAAGTLGRWRAATVETEEGAASVAG